MSKQTAIRLPDELHQRLASLAKATGRTTSYYIREAITEHLQDLEDVYLAQQTLERIRQGQEKTYSLAEVEQAYGLAD